MPDSKLSLLSFSGRTRILHLTWFAIGIRMIGEKFPARQVGVAEGLYGGWGNSGSAAAAPGLPMIALM